MCAPHGRGLGRARPATRGRRVAGTGPLAAGVGTLSPETGELGSLTGGAPTILPCGLNLFDRVKVIQTV
jgi:hypothetical protein